MAPNPDPDFRLVARAVFEMQLKRLEYTSQLQGEYGKWFVATVSAVQVGAIYFVGIVANDVKLADKLPAFWIFIGGLVLILLSGLAAWWNWGLHVVVYETWGDARMLVDPVAWPKTNDSLGRQITATYWLSIVLGIASVLCIPLGAWVLTSAH